MNHTVSQSNRSPPSETCGPERCPRGVSKHDVRFSNLVVLFEFVCPSAPRNTAMTTAVTTRSQRTSQQLTASVILRSIPSTHAHPRSDLDRPFRKAWPPRHCLNHHPTARRAIASSACATLPHVCPLHCDPSFSTHPCFLEPKSFAPSRWHVGRFPISVCHVPLPSCGPDGPLRFYRVEHDVLAHDAEHHDLLALILLFHEHER